MARTCLFLPARGSRCGTPDGRSAAYGTQMWIMFTVPCPTPDGRTAKDLYDKRVGWISDEMRESARSLGCRFHHAWYAEDGSQFVALAWWDSRDDARTFFRMWDIEDEPGEVATVLEGHVGLAPTAFGQDQTG